MTLRQASEQIGCSVHHLKRMARKGQIRTKKLDTPWGRFTYDISQAEVNRIKKTPNPGGLGWPRGVSRT